MWSSTVFFPVVALLVFRVVVVVLLLLMLLAAGARRAGSVREELMRGASGRGDSLSAVVVVETTCRRAFSARAFSALPLAA